MQLKNEISEELRQLSMVVAGMPRKMPYEVPEGYFAAFPGQMSFLADTNDEPSALDPEDKPFSPGWGKGPAFSVPEGYFEGFASRMLDKIKAQAGQEEKILDAREELAGLSPLLSGMDKKMPYHLPEGYFDTLEAIIAEENLFPLMTGLKDRETYQVPAGYFESFPEILSARVQPVKAPARVISISRQRKAWWQYSAAAVILGFVFTLGWLRLHTPAGRQGPTNADVAQGLTRISDQDIQSFMDNQDNHVAPVQQDAFIGNSTASLEFSDNDIKSFLGDISDNELNQYMAEHGDLKDYPTN